MYIDYKAKGSSGYRCQLTGEAGLSITVTLAEGVTHVEAAPADLPLQAVVSFRCGHSAISCAASSGGAGWSARRTACPSSLTVRYTSRSLHHR